MMGDSVWICYILEINKRKASGNLPGKDENCCELDSMIDSKSSFCNIIFFFTLIER
jgi:hypothetical protein